MTQNSRLKWGVLVLVGLLAVAGIAVVWTRRTATLARPPQATSLASAPRLAAPRSSVKIRTQAQGRALPEVGVLLQHIANGKLFFTELSDASGEANFASVPTGAYRLTTMYVGFTSRSRTVSINGPQETLTVTLQRDNQAGPAPHASASAPAEAGLGSISGRVVDASGTPVANAQVGAAGEGPPHFTTTDEKGHFDLVGLRGERLNLFATETTHAATHSSDVPNNSKDVKLVMQMAAEIQGDLEFQTTPEALYVRLCHIDPTYRREVCVKSEYYVPPEPTYRLRRVPSGKFSLVFADKTQELKRIELDIRPGEKLQVPLQRL